MKRVMEIDDAITEAAYRIGGAGGWVLILERAPGGAVALIEIRPETGPPVQAVVTRSSFGRLGETRWFPLHDGMSLVTPDVIRWPLGGRT